ncbi:LptA/OstA family protein [Terricaulis sp.]|uniref:LptA/OstA family protein n=1 Tax=Terricaulis sp. TaxID=2768686 RepID=UPI002AC595EC|nr:LptA/OstA family protein [Terricaulis sp.]MDZ4692587.1 LptA/OstA family protein [Terricaulis sp.]
MRPAAFFIAAGALFVAAFSAPDAHAQLSEGGGPVSYSADNLEYFDGERRLVLTGDVDIVQNDARLRADRITLFFSGSTAAAQGQQGLGSGDIERMIAEGEVYYVRPAQSARGNRAVYEIARDSVTFSGNVVVASDENVIRGETLVLQIGTRRTTIRPTPGQRVRGVFVPSQGGNQPGANR